MKNLMRIMSVLLAFVCLMLIIARITEPEPTGDFAMFVIKIALIFTANILPIISIAICAYCMERNDTNYIIRIIPIYMCIPIALSSIMVIFETNAQWLADVYNFLSNTFQGVTILSIIMIIKPNNKITTIIKYIAIGLLATDVILSIISSTKSYMVETLPNVYGYQNYGGFNFSTVSETNEFVAKVQSITSIAQLFMVLLLFTTNYAFSEKIELSGDDLDYDTVKQDALNIANKQMEQIYFESKKPQEEVIDRSASEKGLMNINNQLGQNSNVGTVKEKAKETNVTGSSLESLITLANNPVENKTGEEENENNVTEQVIESTPQQNLDVQEQMKEKLKNEQMNNQIVQQTIPQQIPNQPVEQVMPQQLGQQVENQVQEQQTTINQNIN